MKSVFKIFSVILVLCIFTGCTPKPSQDNKISVWHWMTDRKESFQELAREYKEKTGIDVEFRLFFPPDIYAQKVIAAARASNLPDVFGILGERKTLASFIKAGYILNLDTYMNNEDKKWRTSFYPQALAVVTFNDKNSYNTASGIYGVPIDTTVMQFTYNKTLLKKLGLNNAPTTFHDFIAIAKRAEEELGVVGFICGWGEGWLLNAVAIEWALNVMGEKKFLKTIAGEILYTDDDWLKVFSLFSELKKSGILAPDIATMTNKESEAVFAKGKALFSFNGSWSVNVYKQLSPDLEYGFFSLPKASSKYPVKVWGGAGSSFMVNAKSSNKEKVIDFLKWLTEKKQQAALAVNTNNLPSVKGCEGGLSPILKSLLPSLNNLTHPDTWPQNEDSRVIEVMNRGLQQIVMGLKTPETVAGEIQNKKNKISRK